jgi:NAD-dependent deacetylase
MSLLVKIMADKAKDNIHDSISEKILNVAADMIVNSEKVVVFTGSGLTSTNDMQSGKTGDKALVNKEVDDSFPKFVGDPSIHKRRSQWYNMFNMIESIKPNDVHYAIADIHKMGRLYCVITQNVDGVHQKSGIPEDKVIELHGSLRRLKCLSCGKQYPILEISKKIAAGTIEEPLCDACGGKLKSATTSFGEPPLSAEMIQAEKFSRSCDLFMVVGSTLMIYPAASIPMYAIESGAQLLVVNEAASSIDHKADLVINQSIIKVLPYIISIAKGKAGIS